MAILGIQVKGIQLDDRFEGAGRRTRDPFDFAHGRLSPLEERLRFGITPHAGRRRTGAGDFTGRGPATSLCARAGW